MGVNAMWSMETRAALTENVTLNGTAAFSTTQARTGSASIRCNPASGAAGSFSGGGLFRTFYMSFGLYVATMPSIARVIAGQAAANTNNLLLNTNGTISFRVNTTVVGTSSTALTTGQWYWIGFRNLTDGASAVLLQINGIDQVTGTSGTAAVDSLGFIGTEASAVDAYFDDVIGDSLTLLAPSKVGLAVPISDNAVGSGWTLGTGTAIASNSGSTAVKNEPPVGVADLAAGSDTKQIRNAANNTNAYAANLTTYTSLGLASDDTVLAVQPLASTAAPSATSPKSGSFTVSNPTVAKASFGQFYNGAAIAGTFPTGWSRRLGSVEPVPTVTVGSSPVVTVTQDTGSTRIAMVSFLGLLVAWTPAALVTTAPGTKISATGAGA